jgi:hypothetical protein
MILNARQIHRENNGTTIFPPIILLAMEDITMMMEVAETLASHTKQFERTMAQRTEALEIHIKNLEKQIKSLK